MRTENLSGPEGVFVATVREGRDPPGAGGCVKAAEAYGADGILVLPPSVTPANDDGLVDYYRAIAASTKLGIVLFQTPAFNFSVGLLRCLREVPNIVGYER